MALEINSIYKQEKDAFSEEPIMITIALGEYRSLIEENTRLLCENRFLNDEINKLLLERDNHYSEEYRKIVRSDNNAQKENQ